MTKNENRQRIKNEALNKIAKIYHPKYKFSYDDYCGNSRSEQREETVYFAISEMKSQLDKLK